MLLAYAAGATLSEMTRQFKTNYPKVNRCVSKALQMGALLSLSDLPGRGRRARITPEARAALQQNLWVCLWGDGRKCA